MFRTLLSLMTISALLICPLRCSAVESAGESEVEQGCSCCHTACEDAPRRSTENVPGEPCDCGNCLCHGALPEQLSPLASIALLAGPLDFSFLAATLPAPASDAVSSPPPRWDRFLLCGRDRCLAKGVLQI